jgi:tetratricopeptide (TPR) repeat protein
VTDYTRAIELEPTNPIYLSDRAWTYLRLERYDEALADYSRSIEITPEEASGLIDRAFAYNDMQRYDEALIDADRAIQLWPNEPQGYACRGYTLLHIARYYGYHPDPYYKEAIEALTLAIERQSDHATALRDRGYAYMAVGRYDEALADLNRSLELVPNNDWSLYSRALVQLLRGREQEAHADLAKGTELAREWYEREPRNWRNTFNLVLYYVAASEFGEAERLVNEGISSGASSYRIREAMEGLEDFLALFPGHSQALALKQMLKSALQSRS